MICKIFELRDRATFIPIMAIKAIPDNQDQHYLLRRAGYGVLGADFDNHACILLCRLNANNDKICHDWPMWGDRTFSVAHQYIEKNFDSLEDGSVIDVEFILGETTQMKVSERFETYP